MINLTELIQGTEQSLEDAADQGSLEPVFSALKNLKLAYQESELSSVEKFVTTKGIRASSNCVVDSGIYCGKSTLVLHLDQHQREKELIALIEDKKRQTTTVDERLYVDSEKYLVGIVVEWIVVKKIIKI